MPDRRGKIASAPTALDVLLRARELPWTQGAYARSASGSPVYYGSIGAVRFCPEGACRRATLDLGAPLALAREAEAALFFALPLHPDGKGYRSLAGYNDASDRTEAEVRAVEDRAIEQEVASRG